MNKVCTILIPIYWTKYRKKPKVVKLKTKTKYVYEEVVLVGFNWYRNAFHIDQNNCKKEFESIISKQLKLIKPIENSFAIKSTLYYSNILSDAGNIIPMLEKFVLDALQESGIVKNDNVKYHKKHLGWEVFEDKINPRLEIEVWSI